MSLRKRRQGMEGEKGGRRMGGGRASSGQEGGQGLGMLDKQHIGYGSTSSDE